MTVSADRSRRYAVGVLSRLIWGACLLLSAPLHAGELQRFELETQGDGYRLQAQGLIQAPIAAVREVLIDYPALHRVSPRIIESKLVGVTADGVSRVRTLNRFCFLGVCRDFRHMQRIRELRYGDFESESVAPGCEVAVA